MIKKVNEAWKRLLSNDYAYFLIVPLLFAIVSIPVSTLFLRLGWFEQTDVNTFSTQWVMGFLFALYLHWRRKSKAQSHIEQVLQRALQKCEALFFGEKIWWIGKVGVMLQADAERYSLQVAREGVG